MRSIQWVAIGLVATVPLLSGCDSHEGVAPLVVDGGAVTMDGGDTTKPPSGLAYTVGTAIHTVGVAAFENVPTSTGGSVSSYSVSPPLPAGLTLSGTSGIISGTPTVATPVASYTVTASNALGSSTTTLSLTVQLAPTVQSIPNMGQQITPLAPKNARHDSMNPDLPDLPDWLAGQAATTVVSPDGNTMLVLTSGFNRIYSSTTGKIMLQDSMEYVFVYDISAPVPVKKQVLKIVMNTYHGIVFDPSGKAFYVPGTVNHADGSASDLVHQLTWSSTASKWVETDTPLALGHTSGVGLAKKPPNGEPVNAQVGVNPFAAGAAISTDGKTLAVINHYNDSMTVFTGGYGSWKAQPERDLRPGKSGGQSGQPGGQYPFWVQLKGTGADATAYVSSIRDREIVVVPLSGPMGPYTRIPVKGQPNKMTMNKAQSLLYVAVDQTDTVEVIDTETNKIVESISVIGPAFAIPPSLKPFKGANTNSVTLSPDEKQLYVTNGNLNAVAVVSLAGTHGPSEVLGLIPTGWYPNSVGFSADGKTVYVANQKSPTGANPSNCYIGGGAAFPSSPLHPGAVSCQSKNAYNPQLTKAGLQSFPRPDSVELRSLTEQVASNNRFTSSVNPEDAAVLDAVRKGVKHVIFIIKENRTYDQLLGDLEVGNGDPELAEFGKLVTPNTHNLARTFVTLDNFMDTSEVSNDGWLWTTSARCPDTLEHQMPVAYSGRGTSLDSEGPNRSVNVALPTLAERIAANPLTPNDPDIMAGTNDIQAPDGPNNEINGGYLWNTALRAGLTVRNYGFLVDGTRYNFTSTSAYSIPLERDPFSKGTVVAYPANVALAPFTDPYFRGFDLKFPDYYRFKEWEREFDTNYANGGLPALSLVRFMHDHTGEFADAMDDINTPERQVADNDYAVGLLVEKIANSRYANDTLIFVIQDDSQDGGDHVDSHRSIALIAGAYVKRGAVVSTLYNTIDFVRTIEEVLGLKPVNMNDALARPMADIFTATPSPWTFKATPSPYLYDTKLSPLLPPKPTGLRIPRTTRDSKYWAQVTKGMDFSAEDRFDFAAYNRVLWTGLMGNKPYPSVASGKDLRHNRAALLERHARSKRQAAPQH